MPGAPGTRRVNVLTAHVVNGSSPALLDDSPRSRRARRKVPAHKWVPRPEPGTLAVIGAPLCEGQSLGGVNLAPGAFRSSGFETAVRNLAWDFLDLGDVERAGILAQTVTFPVNEDYYPREMVKNSVVVGAGVQTVHEKASEAASGGNFVLTIGGDHSIAAGTISGIMRQRPELAVIWVDAHSDCNTPETSPSKNYHGMPLAHLLGWFNRSVAGFEWMDEHLKQVGALPEDRVALIALRDVDPPERELLQNSGVHVFTMSDVVRRGIGEVMEMALQCVDPKRRRPLHLSFDIDGCDPTIAPGTGTKARGGLSYRESHYICERLASTGRLGSMDLVEINPALDRLVEEGMHGDDPDIRGTETVRLGIELVTSALGKTTV